MDSKKKNSTGGASPVELLVKILPANAGDVGSTPGSARSPGKGDSNPLQHSYLDNPMDRGAWRATVHGVAKSWTCPSSLIEYIAHSEELGWPLWER